MLSKLCAPFCYLLAACSFVYGFILADAASKLYGEGIAYYGYGIGGILMGLFWGIAASLADDVVATKEAVERIEKLLTSGPEEKARQSQRTERDA